MENKELMSAITLYRSQYEAIIKLPDPDFRIITGAILKYAFDNEMPKDLTTLQLAVFDMCKGNIDKSNERRRMKAERNKKYYENQKKFSHIKTRSDTLRQVQTGSSHNENENVNVNENVNENENENENNNIYNNSLSERENFLKKFANGTMSGMIRKELLIRKGMSYMSKAMTAQRPRNILRAIVLMLKN